MVDVPIERLITNLLYAEKQCKDDKCKADVEYRLARLYSMRYARGAKTVPINKNDEASDTVTDPYLQGYEAVLWPNYRQYEVSNSQLDADSKKALDEAISGYRKSLKLQSDNMKALLGLGWCLKEQGTNPEAIVTLRKAIALAKQGTRATEKEQSAAQGFRDEKRLAQEAAVYLIPLLDTKNNADEIAELSALGTPNYRPSWVTPIVVPTSAYTAPDKLMRKCAVSFDIDGFGKQNLNAWPATNAGWLVWDPRGKGKINSGVRLFGSSSFWISWNNGYEVLSALDDNHDGQLTGKELDGLALWVDANADGKADPGEVRALTHYKIDSVSSRFSQLGSVLSNSRGVKFTSGQTAPTCDWIYKIESNESERLAQHRSVKVSMTSDVPKSAEK
jgi:tetratricopeptide (TPR) repeat protein